MEIQNQNAHNAISKTQSDLQVILKELGIMAIYRVAEVPQAESLLILAKRLVQEDLSKVIVALRLIGETKRAQGENAFPDLGTILEFIDKQKPRRTIAEKMAAQNG